MVNATGVFADRLRQIDAPTATPMIRASQGVHIVLDRDFLPGDSAIMVPHTDDGRVLFAIPWHGRVLVGTTDTPVESIESEPRPFPDEIDFLLRHCARYLTRDPQPGDVLSVFAGLRPLVRSGDDESTAEVSRDHTVSVSRSGLVTIAGGKWTTYRKMAQDTIDQAAMVGGLPTRPCVTSDINAHGYHAHAERFGRLAAYGSDAPAIEQLATSDPDCAALLHPSFEHRVCEVIWAVRQEMARTLHDVLARRTRMLLLDARASIEAAPTIAAILARELHRGERWAQEQVCEYERRASGYLVPD